jgi:phosphotransferase system enzyme I (PtsP)
VIVGRALGAIAALRRPPSRPSERSPHAGRKRDPDADVRLLRGAFDVADKAIRGLADRSGSIGLGREASFLGTYSEILEDVRLRQRACEIASTGVGVAQALAQVARDVTRTAVAFTRDPYLEERARDVEDLCDALTILAEGDKRSALPSKALIVGDTLTVFDLLVSARSQPVGIALTDRASGPRLRALLKLMNIPAVVGIEGLFRWAADGDVALLDGDHGLLVINPSKAEMASLREYRRSGKAS